MTEIFLYKSKKHVLPQRSKDFCKDRTLTDMTHLICICLDIDYYGVSCMGLRALSTVCEVPPETSGRGSGGHWGLGVTGYCGHRPGLQGHV